MVQNPEKLNLISNVLDLNDFAVLSPMSCTDFLVLSAERMSAFSSLV